MKRLLVGAAAIALCSTVAAPAPAAPLQLGVAGHFKGYVSWDNQDVLDGAGGYRNERNLDIVHDTEIHFTGETTLDNGLTVGVHVEAEADAGNAFAVDKSYAYFSGAWGRVNFGDEDGAAYLLQVAAPSADNNVDGIRQYVNPMNYSASSAAFPVAGFGPYGAIPAIGLTHLGNIGTGELDYANDATRHADKITYLTPLWEGFQLGLSYTPTIANGTTLPSTGVASRSLGTSTKSDENFSSAYEGAIRWEGKFDQVGINLGGGYTLVKWDDATNLDMTDFKQWNVGADVNFQAFGLGAVYTRNNQADVAGSSNDEKTFVVGADYTTGPFKIGTSWLHDKAEGITPAFTGGDLKTNRYSAGVVYTFAPGMSFRGSVGFVRTKVADLNDANANYGLLGTQINF